MSTNRTAPIENAPENAVAGEDMFPGDLP